MSVLFVGTERECFYSDIDDIDTGTAFDSAYARSSINLWHSHVYAWSPYWSPVTEAWMHFDLVQAGTSSGYSAWRFILQTDAGVNVASIVGGGNGGPLSIARWTGSAWSASGTLGTLTGTTRGTFDCRVVCGASGSIELFKDGLSLGILTGAFGANIGRVVFTGGNNTQPKISQVVIADEMTLGWKVKTIPAIGAGANTDWDGAYTDINENSQVTDHTFMAGDANDEQTFVGAGYTPAGGVEIAAVVVNARLKKGNSGPTQAQLMLRKGGTDYFSATKSLAAGAFGFQPVQHIFEVDPDTGVTWTPSDAGDASLEFGMKAIT